MVKTSRRQSLIWALSLSFSFANLQICNQFFATRSSFISLYTTLNDTNSLKMIEKSFVCNTTPMCFFCFLFLPYNFGKRCYGMAHRLCVLCIMLTCSIQSHRPLSITMEPILYGHVDITKTMLT